MCPPKATVLVQAGPLEMGKLACPWEQLEDESFPTDIPSV